MGPGDPREQSSVGNSGLLGALGFLKVLFI